MYVCKTYAEEIPMPAVLSRKRLIRSASRPRRQAERTEATRQRLLHAAECIFARDGFEASRLEDIVARAGYTRGAFYAHYDSKEDLLFDLMERFVNEKVGNLRAILAQAGDSVGRWQALRAYYSRMACDRRWALLSMEFKLFAIRHPAARQRLALRYRRLREPGLTLMTQLLEEQGRDLPVSIHAATVALGAAANSLLIESLVDHKALSEKEIPILLSLVFDAVLGMPSGTDRR
jgi:AcrR family transcriptional regulator